MKRMELQDWLLLAGAALFLGGIAGFSVRVAAIVAGLLCFLGMWMVERTQAASARNALIDARTQKIEARKGADGSAHK